MEYRQLEFLYFQTQFLDIFLKNSLIIHEEKTKKIATMSVVLYVIKNQVHLHKLDKL